jgi:hypothetical protein
MADRDDIAARSRLGQAIEKRLDQVEAARRLASLLDAAGKPNPIHQAASFRVRWELAWFLDKLVARRRACERGRRRGLL